MLTRSFPFRSKPKRPPRKRAANATTLAASTATGPRGVATEEIHGGAALAVVAVATTTAVVGVPLEVVAAALAAVGVGVETGRIRRRGVAVIFETAAETSALLNMTSTFPATGVVGAVADETTIVAGGLRHGLPPTLVHVLGRALGTPALHILVLGLGPTLARLPGTVSQIPKQAPVGRKEHGRHRDHSVAGAELVSVLVGGRRLPAALRPQNAAGIRHLGVDRVIVAGVQLGPYRRLARPGTHVAKVAEVRGGGGEVHEAAAAAAAAVAVEAIAFRLKRTRRGD